MSSTRPERMARTERSRKIIGERGKKVLRSIRPWTIICLALIYLVLFIQYSLHHRSSTSNVGMNTPLPLQKSMSQHGAMRPQQMHSLMQKYYSPHVKELLNETLLHALDRTAVLTTIDSLSLEDNKKNGTNVSIVVGVKGSGKLISYEPYNYTASASRFLPQVLAIHFPQYHRDPLNDYFWGKGFTDWDNLRKSPLTNRLGFPIPRPLDEIHGYYDLKETSARREQGLLARAYGVDGFVYHHYWFYDPERPGATLGAPLEALLEDGQPYLPFCLNWANVKWVNTWHGDNLTPEAKVALKGSGVLQHQNFPKNDDEGLITAHYEWLRRFFHHPNYLRTANGEPIFMIYAKKPGSFPVLRRLRELALADGFPGRGLYFSLGVDKPHRYLNAQTEPLRAGIMRWRRIVGHGIFDRSLAYPSPSAWNDGVPLSLPDWCRNPSSVTPDRIPPPRKNQEIPGIVASFDNTPRRTVEDATLWSAGPPHEVLDRFRSSFRAALYYESCCPFAPYNDGKGEDYSKNRFVVVNAWNEWAEGMTLEPSDVYGHGFLEIIRDVKADLTRDGCGTY